MSLAPLVSLRPYLPPPRRHKPAIDLAPARPKPAHDPEDRQVWIYPIMGAAWRVSAGPGVEGIAFSGPYPAAHEFAKNLSRELGWDWKMTTMHRGWNREGVSVKP